MIDLPPYTTRELVLERLPLIFLEGTPNRPYVIREMAASTVLCMLYVGAIEENERYIRPAQICRMSHEQAALSSNEDRHDYASRSLEKSFVPVGTRWYADNTRESIRDETIREGLVQLNAVITRTDVATTSSKPRYRLKKDFAALFDPEATGAHLAEAISRWQKTNLSRSALMRLSLAAYQHQSDGHQVMVTFPDGETRKLAAGPSSDISKAVIEIFAPKFLEQPVVLWLSTSDRKVVARDDKVANSIGLQIDVSKDLPDVILVDLAPHDPLLLFTEVVYSDGAVTERRQKAIYEMTDAAGFKRSQVAFLTAYLDRDAAGFKKTGRELAWNSYAWFVSEPEKLLIQRDGAVYLHRLSEADHRSV